jgi:hypothetical protein
LPGVRRAIVTRVLPDRLRVRVIERVPLAVVRTDAGHFLWVDEEGVALGEMKPADSVPSFFIRGWNEDGTEEARTENAERVQKYQEVLREWSSLGLAERVSEVDLIDIKNIRAQLAGNDSQIEVRLGGQELGPRLKQALSTLDQYKQAPQGSSITYLDLTTGRIVIGLSSGSKVADAPVIDEQAKTSETTAAMTSTPPKSSTVPGENGRRTESESRKNNKQKAGAAKEPANHSQIRLR